MRTIPMRSAMMRSAMIKTKTALSAALLLSAAGAAFAQQQQINLTAAPANATLSDGSVVPMWGYSCGAAVSGSTATCAAANPAALSGWSPVIVTVPSGQDLQINLTNSLSFANGNTVPTSLTIVGQIGGGLGDVTQRTTTPSPDHSKVRAQTWPILTGATAPAPAQGDRVQSFATEVAAGATASLCWGPTCTTPTPALLPGTYLIESGTHPSIQGPMGLYGILVVTDAVNGIAYPAAGSALAVKYNADIPLLFSEIDPVQNTAVSQAVNTATFNETAVWSGAPGACGDPTVHTCYPPAVNYTPLYYLINGRTFDTTNVTASLFNVNPLTGATAAVTGNVLVRMVNAGLKMHVPSIVGSTTGTTPTPGMTLVAEDGNVLPGLARMQNEVFMAAGKTYDVMINAPVACVPVSPATSCTNTALPIYDRELSLSANANMRNAGMLAYIGINGATPPLASSGTTATAAVAKNDSYSLVPGQMLSVSDPTRGVIANDTGVYTVQLYAAPANGTVTLFANGTFQYFPTIPTAGSPAKTDSFTYCANGTVTGTGSAATCSSGISATVSLGASTVAGDFSCTPATYSGAAGPKTATSFAVKTPGILANCTHTANLPLTVAGNSLSNVTSGLTVVPDAAGGFTATAAGPGSYSFTVNVQDPAQHSHPATVTVVFPSPSSLAVTVLDGADHVTRITDYRWIIEEDRTFYVDPACTTNPLPAGCPVAITTGPAAGAPVNYGTNFHTSSMPVVAAGCTGALSCESGQKLQGTPVVCDVGNGVCDPSRTQQTVTTPDQVTLDPGKRYYITIFPGDAATPFNAGYLGSPTNCASTAATAAGGTATTCGHGMGGAEIPAACGALSAGKIACASGVVTGFAPVTVLAVPTPLPSSTLSVIVYEDDYPLNGEQGPGGGVDVVAPQEPGLGDFQITIYDQAGQTGAATGTPTYDMSNQPLSNALAGTIDPVTGLDACPISPVASANSKYNIANAAAIAFNTANAAAIASGTVTAKLDSTGAVAAAKSTATAMIVTCPKFESDGQTLSPMAGQALVKNLYPGRYGIAALPGASRIALGEEWVQTNTLDGQKAHDSFMRVGEPGYFQEFGPAGYHVSIGFANPKIINDRRNNTVGTGMCDTGAKGGNLACGYEVKGKVTGSRLSRTPDSRLYSSGSRASLAFTQCYVSLGDPDGAEIAFSKCDSDGNFDFKGIPAGNWKITTFDQWNDQIIDGITQPVSVGCIGNVGGLCGTPTAANQATANPTCVGASTTNTTCDMGEIGVHQWQADLYTRTFIDTTGTGVSDDTGNGSTKPGLALAATNIRFRDGSYSDFNNTDLNGFANFNEEFPLFNWYVVETDSTRYKTTGVHVIYDAGGPADGSKSCGTSAGPNPQCGGSSIASGLANTYENNPLPASLIVPGSVPCATADCFTEAGLGGIASGVKRTTGYSSTPPNSTGRIDPPFWFGSYGWQGYIGQGNFLEFGKKPFATNETGPIHGHVIYASTRPFDNPQLLLQAKWEPLVAHVTVNLYQEGVAADGTTTLKLIDTTQTSSWDDWVQGFRPDGIPNMNCPGQQGSTDPFYYALQDQPQYLDWYNAQHNGGTLHTLPNHSQFKCYDGMHTWNQLQPAPYDGMYSFPSVTGFDPVTGKPIGTNCKACVNNPDASDPYRFGTPMLPAGKYVVEVVVPPGYELVKEEDKNILIGDNFIAPAAVQFPGLASAVYILPDQAQLSSSYNPSNPQNPTNSLGRIPSLVSNEGDTGSVEEYWPCVGEMRQVPDYISLFPQSLEVSPFAGAMRPLCDRKEVTLNYQGSAVTKFYIFTSAHVSSHFQGIILDDFASEFDPFSPQFGEKFAPSYLPVGVKDWTGNAVNRVYSDQFGLYNGLNYSTWEVNPPNPTGYAPTMMVMCMNDAGLGSTPDPLFQPGYSQFCYELPFMPGQTGYFDTPVVPVEAFASGSYNRADCAYPDATPAIKSVVNADPQQPQGPWVNPGSVATAASASFTVSGVARCTATNCGTPSSIIFPSGTVTCTANGTGGPNCSANSGNGRSSNVAAYIRSNIASLMGSGYTASGTGATVIVTATATGTGANGTPVVTAESNVLSPSGTVALAGGINASTASMVLTITALGDQSVDWYGYTGPSATKSPYNQQKISRHYGFGPAPTSTNCAAGQPCVTLIGADGSKHPLTNVSWSDTSITGTVPTGVPNCAVQQQAQYGGSTAQCGQLVITTASGKQSVDTVTVTIGGKQPSVLAAGATIQSAIDAASPGDMIIVPPGTYNEMLVMWKPIRLQGVGAATTVVDANTQPAGRLLNPWRQKIVCLFGLTADGRPDTSTSRSCVNGLVGATNKQSGNQWMNFPSMVVDRLPFEATLGWDATLNGNLAEQLIEPSLLGAYEGAAITVLGKGVKFPRGTSILDAFGATTGTPGASFPTNTTLLSNNDCGGSSSSNPYPTNFYCNPSSIDGLGIRDSSQGGGGIFVHAYAHNIQISNNRVSNNTGTMSGGITIGTGEHPDVALGGFGQTITSYPTSCETSNIQNLSLPFCFNVHVNVHHNAVVSNSSMGDELFSSTPAGAGGVSINTGSDYYKFANNWVCGNLSSGDGGGVSHIGFIKNGDIEANTIIFNQSTNPSITTNGGGLLVMGAPDADPTTCGVANDQDCLPPPGTVAPSDGTGPGLTINANLILGNAADSGSGGGLRIQHVNGTDVLNVPFVARGFGRNTPKVPACTADLGLAGGNNSYCYWNSVNVTNNIIVNNVAGWDGGGVSLLDALAVNMFNNTIASNDSTASSGALFQALFAPLASAASPNGNVICGADNGQSCPQVAGLVSVNNSPVLQANINLLSPLAGTSGPTFFCPGAHGVAVAGKQPSCFNYSIPLLVNDAIWQNRSFYIGVGAPAGSGNTSQQNQVRLYPMGSTTPAATQTVTGGCPAGSSYWDLGLRGDTNLTNHAPFGFAPYYSVFSSTSVGTTATNPAIYGGSNNQNVNPLFTSQYCNGSRSPPELGAAGYAVPPGVNEFNAFPNPVFTLNPAGVVDEGNNWVNVSWGPLALTNPAVGISCTGSVCSDSGTAPALGNYAPAVTSPAIDSGTGSVTVGTSTVAAPTTDFFGNARPSGNGYDIGAVEVHVTAVYSATVSPGSLAFGNWATGTTDVLALTVTNTGNQTLAGGSFTFSGVTAGSGFARANGGQGGGGTCGATLAVGATCTYNVAFAPTTVGAKGDTLTVAYTNATVTGSSVSLTGTAVNMAVDPASLAFSVPVTSPATTSAAQTLTVHNATGGTRSLSILVAGPYARATIAQGGAGSCGATLANNASCTINVVFTPAALGPAAGGTVTITTNGGFTVANSPVTLSGTGVAPVVAASLAPATWTPSATRGCNLLSCPAQAFTLTNTGNVTLTGITQGALATGSSTDFAKVALLSNCGPAGGGQFGANTTLAPGATCNVEVRFAPPAGDTTGTKSATLNVGTSAGTQAAALTGTAN